MVAIVQIYWTLPTHDVTPVVVACSRLHSFSLTHVGTALISISTPGIEYAQEHKDADWFDVLRVKFDDCEYKIDFRTKLIDEAVADQIYNFIKKHRKRNIVVHCDVGMSRSMAVAAWMRDVFNFDARFATCNTDQYMNKLVYKMLQQAHEASLERCRSLV